MPPPWVQLILFFSCVMCDVIFTRESCSPDTFGGLQPIQGNPLKYRQCSGAGFVWIVPCQPGYLFDPVDKVCRADTEQSIADDNKQTIHSSKKYRPTPNSAIGVTQKPTENAAEFLFTTRRPIRPLKGSRIKNGLRIRTTTKASMLATIRPRTRPTPRIRTVPYRGDLLPNKLQKGLPVFPPPRPRIRTTTNRPLIRVNQQRTRIPVAIYSTTERPRYPTTTTTSTTLTTTAFPFESIESKTTESFEHPAEEEEEEIPIVGYRKTTPSPPSRIKNNNIDNDYEYTDEEELETTTQIVTTTTPLWVQASSTHKTTIMHPLSASVKPMLPAVTEATLTRPRTNKPLVRASLSSNPNYKFGLTTPRTPFRPPGAASSFIKNSTFPSFILKERAKTSTLPPKKIPDSARENALQLISGEVLIPQTTTYPTLLTYPTKNQDKIAVMPTDLKSGIDEKTIIKSQELSISDREFLKELMQMVKNQQTAETTAHQIEEDRQRKILEKMSFGRPLILPPRNSIENGWTNLPHQTTEIPTVGGHIKTTKSSEKPYTQKVHPYPEDVPAPLRPIYPGFSTPDIIRFTTQPPLEIIRFTPAPSSKAPEVNSNWVTSKGSWKPPPEDDKAAEVTEAPASLTLLTGCIIGTKCPLLGDAELLCEHPDNPSYYLQCVPTAFRGGIWTERACPDTLVFIGDRCDKQHVRDALLAAGQPVIAVSEMPDGETASPLLLTTPPLAITAGIPIIPETNEIEDTEYLQWQRIGTPTKPSMRVGQPHSVAPSPSPIHGSIDLFPKDLIELNRPHEVIDYSQVFPLFPRVQPSFLMPRRRPQQLQFKPHPSSLFNRSPLHLRPIYDSPQTNATEVEVAQNQTASGEDFIVDKVVKPALKKIAKDSSKSFLEMLVAGPVRQMDAFIADKISNFGHNISTNSTTV